MSYSSIRVGIHFFRLSNTDEMTDSKCSFEHDCASRATILKSASTPRLCYAKKKPERKECKWIPPAEMRVSNELADALFIQELLCRLRLSTLVAHEV